MVPPLRYRGDVVKALLAPDLGPIRQPNPTITPILRRPCCLMVNHY